MNEFRIYQDMLKVIEIIERKWENIEPKCSKESIDLDIDYYYFENQEKEDALTSSTQIKGNV